MAKQSAGILLYRIKSSEFQIFLVHPGGPFFKNKDAGVWSIPKGEFLDDEGAIIAAKREFLEEIGQTIYGDFIALNPVKLKSGKTVYAWAVERDINETNIQSNTFPLEWPPKSGKFVDTPEVDKGDWFDVETAKIKINPAQTPLIDELVEILQK